MVCNVYHYIWFHSLSLQHCAGPVPSHLLFSMIFRPLVCSLLLEPGLHHPQSTQIHMSSLSPSPSGHEIPEVFLIQEKKETNLPRRTQRNMMPTSPYRFRKQTTPSYTQKNSFLDAYKWWAPFPHSTVSIPFLIQPISITMAIYFS